MCLGIHPGAGGKVRGEGFKVEGCHYLQARMKQFVAKRVEFERAREDY